MFGGLFKKKQPAVNARQKIQDFLTLAFQMDKSFNGAKLMKPLYVGWLRDEAQANAAHAKLPMLYIWNEDPEKGSFSLSVNGPLVSELLETLLPREHPQFMEVRDELMQVLRQMTISTVTDTCGKLGLMPSQVFSAEMQPT